MPSGSGSSHRGVHALPHVRLKALICIGNIENDLPKQEAALRMSNKRQMLIFEGRPQRNIGRLEQLSGRLGKDEFEESCESISVSGDALKDLIPPIVKEIKIGSFPPSARILVVLMSDRKFIQVDFGLPLSRVRIPPLCRCQQHSQRTGRQSFY